MSEAGTDRLNQILSNYSKHANSQGAALTGAIRESYSGKSSEKVRRVKKLQDEITKDVAAIHEATKKLH